MNDLQKWDEEFEKLNGEIDKIEEPPWMMCFVELDIALSDINQYIKEIIVYDSKLVAVKGTAENLKDKMKLWYDLMKSRKRIESIGYLEQLPASKDRDAYVENEVSEYSKRLQAIKTITEVIGAKKRLLYRIDKRLENYGHNLRKEISLER
jgi:hypothetical protein